MSQARRAWAFDPLPRAAYGVIVADPPWPWAGGQSKSGEAHYRTMALDRIVALPVAALARPDCVLMLWATGPLLDRAVLAMSAWGFSYKSHLVWRKVTTSGRVRMGTGYWARSMHETVLIGTRGSPRAARLPSVIDGVAREHSRKPTEFFDAVRRATPRARRLELFAREARAGWQAWGDQAGMFEAQEMAR